MDQLYCLKQHKIQNLPENNKNFEHTSYYLLGNPMTILFLRD